MKILISESHMRNLVRNLSRRKHRSYTDEVEEQQTPVPQQPTNPQQPQQQTSKLTVPEQTMLGFLSRFLRGEDDEYKNTPIEDLQKNAMFNTRTIYPMVQKLLEKKRNGVKTYDDKTFNALFLTMDKVITKEQKYLFYQEGGKIDNVTYSAQY